MPVSDPSVWAINLKRGSGEPAQITLHALDPTSEAAQTDGLTVIKWTNLPEPTVIDRVAALDDPQNEQAKKVREWDEAQDFNSIQ